MCFGFKGFYNERMINSILACAIHKIARSNCIFLGVSLVARAYMCMCFLLQALSVIIIPSLKCPCTNDRLCLTCFMFLSPVRKLYKGEKCVGSLPWCLEASRPCPMCYSMHWGICGCNVTKVCHTRHGAAWAVNEYQADLSYHCGSAIQVLLLSRQW